MEDFRVGVVGVQGTGISRLIDAVARVAFAEKDPPVLRTARLPAEFSRYRVPMTIVEISSSLENQRNLHQELKLADAVVLTYACDQPETLHRLTDFWLSEIRKLEVKAPIVIAGCKLDAAEDEQLKEEQEEVLNRILLQFPEVEFCIKYSAEKLLEVDEVFHLAQKAVFHPRAPLLNRISRTLRPRCERALKRIFLLFDQDGDDALNDSELNTFQVMCSLNPADIEDGKKFLKNTSFDGINKLGITLRGFLLLHMRFITSYPGLGHETWTALRKFGYGDDLKIRDDLIAVPSKRAPDQGVELTEEALLFLEEIFRLFDLDGDGVLDPTELDALFSTAPECPWDEYPYKDATEKTADGGLSLDGVLSMWSLMTLLEPAKSFVNLMYIGYSGDPASALRLTTSRRKEPKKQQTERRVFNCFVFGPRGAGKSELLNSFLKRPVSKRYIPTIGDRYAVNVDLASEKILVLREIPEDGVKPLLSQKESMAACDIAIFVHDSSDQESWEKTSDMLNAVVKYGEASGFEVPCLIVSAKNDLNPFPEAKHDSENVSRNMGIEAPIPIMLGGLNDVLFHKIVSIADQRPRSSIPQPEAKKIRRQRSRFVNRSLVYVSVGAAVSLVGLAAYRAYAASRMHTSS